MQPCQFYKSVRDRLNILILKHYTQNLEEQKQESLPNSSDQSYITIFLLCTSHIYIAAVYLHFDITLLYRREHAAN